jgi:hypothetical protein
MRSIYALVYLYYLLITYIIVSECMYDYLFTYLPIVMGRLSLYVACVVLWLLAKLDSFFYSVCVYVASRCLLLVVLRLLDYRRQYIRHSWTIRFLMLCMWYFCSVFRYFPFMFIFITFIASLHFQIHVLFLIYDSNSNGNSRYLKHMHVPFVTCSQYSAMWPDTT